MRAAEERDAAGIARVHVAAWRQTYAGMMPADFLANLSVERREQMWATMIRGERPPDTAVFVAEEAIADDAQAGIVGFAMVGRERTGDVEFDGEIWAINIDAAHHRRGLGRGLVLAAARWLAERRFRAMMLWVVAENPARGFYERIGGTLLARTRTRDFGGATLTEVAYGWQLLAEMIDFLEAKPRL
jgi:ribosomal protein S18 acetylase RimI-like enzyme